ncbi:MAG: DUF262 domain-containing protein [Tissierellia bacterium]|nr:DUF262 domain-containing protein [Tissierellia bacterium]
MEQENNKDVHKAAKQISEKRQDIKYSTRDYVVEYLVQKFQEDEFYVPEEYQRKFVWSNDHRCFFIESLLMGLPIPFMFFADTDDGRIEIVDGAQRTYTLAQFVSNDLELENLKVLTNSNGLSFNDFEVAIQRRFLNTNIRVVYLDEGTTIETRQEIFKRINTGGISLVPSEERRGSYQGLFKDFLEECVKNELFNKLAPRTEKTEKRFEGFELVTRFFAYLNNYENKYENYTGRVRDYLDDYIQRQNEVFKNDQEKNKEYYSEFSNMLSFAERILGERGFRKTASSKSTPRARFEALSVGIALALRENPNLKIQDIGWIESDEFNIHTRSDAANNKNRLIGRIDYVKNQLLTGD